MSVVPFRTIFAFTFPAPVCTYDEEENETKLDTLSSSTNKSGITEILQKVYEQIQNHIDDQIKIYTNEFIPELNHKKCMCITEVVENNPTSSSTRQVGLTHRQVNLMEMSSHLSLLGFKLFPIEGRLRYDLTTFKPLDLCYDICYIRHGKTEGNTEPRIYQGQVDYLANFLNEIGLKQAQDAAEKLKQLQVNGQPWTPQVLFSSPLGRALQTAKPILKAFTGLDHAVVDGLKEMAFGQWDNSKVEDIEKTNIAHLFYLKQNVFVKDFNSHDVVESQQLLPPPSSVCYHRDYPGTRHIPSENFLEVITRSRATLLALNHHPLILKSQSSNKTQQPQLPSRVKVIMVGHSMAGAAASILMGHGKCDADGFLGFDGTYIMPNATPTMLLPMQAK